MKMDRGRQTTECEESEVPVAGPHLRMNVSGAADSPSRGDAPSELRDPDEEAVRNRPFASASGRCRSRRVRGLTARRRSLDRTALRRDRDPVEIAGQVMEGGAHLRALHRRFVADDHQLGLEPGERLEGRPRVLPVGGVLHRRAVKLGLQCGDRVG